MTRYEHELQDYREDNEGLHFEFPVLGDKELPEKLVELAQKGNLHRTPQHITPWGLILDLGGTEEDIAVVLHLDQRMLNDFLQTNFKKLNQFAWSDYGVRVAGPAGMTGFAQVYMMDANEEGIALAGVETVDTEMIPLGVIHLTEQGFTLIIEEDEEQTVEKGPAEVVTTA